MRGLILALSLFSFTSLALAQAPPPTKGKPAKRADAKQAKSEERKSADDFKTHELPAVVVTAERIHVITPAESRGLSRLYKLLKLILEVNKEVGSPLDADEILKIQQTVDHLEPNKAYITPDERGNFPTSTCEDSFVRELFGLKSIAQLSAIRVAIASGIKKDGRENALKLLRAVRNMERSGFFLHIPRENFSTKEVDEFLSDAEVYTQLAYALGLMGKYHDARYLFSTTGTALGQLASRMRIISRANRKVIENVREGQTFHYADRMMTAEEGRKLLESQKRYLDAIQILEIANFLAQSKFFVENPKQDHAEIAANVAFRRATKKYEAIKDSLPEHPHIETQVKIIEAELKGLQQNPIIRPIPKKE